MDHQGLQNWHWTMQCSKGNVYIPPKEIVTGGKKKWLELLWDRIKYLMEKLSSCHWQKDMDSLSEELTHTKLCI